MRPRAETLFLRHLCAGGQCRCGRPGGI